MLTNINPGITCHAKCHTSETSGSQFCPVYFDVSTSGRPEEDPFLDPGGTI